MQTNKQTNKHTLSIIYIDEGSRRLLKHLNYCMYICVFEWGCLLGVLNSQFWDVDFRICVPVKYLWSIWSLPTAPSPTTTILMVGTLSAIATIYAYDYFKLCSVGTFCSGRALRMGKTKEVHHESEWGVCVSVCVQVWVSKRVRSKRSEWTEFKSEE